MLAVNGLRRHRSIELDLALRGATNVVIVGKVLAVVRLNRRCKLSLVVDVL